MHLNVFWPTDAHTITYLHPLTKQTGAHFFQEAKLNIYYSHVCNACTVKQLFSFYCHCPVVFP